MPKSQVITAEQFNNLIEFRQRIYENALQQERNAQLELVDALVSGARVRSYAELTLSPWHRRRWSSAYQAMKRGRQDRTALTSLFAAQLPLGAPLILALDGTKWAHPQAQTLTDLTLEPYQQQIKPVHLYSKLSWVPAPYQSWALPLQTLRARPRETEVAVGVRQVRQVKSHLPAGTEALVVADGRYGNHKFLLGMAQSGAPFVVKLAKNRVFYGQPGAYQGMGRPRVRGQRFDFKDPATWRKPNETDTFDHPVYGQVCLQRWDDLRDKRAPHLSLTIVRAAVHGQRRQPPAPLWLGYFSPQTAQAAFIWHCYLHRWPIEPAIRFCKQRLHWTLPRFQATDRCDRWTNLVDIAYWLVWLSRHLVADRPLPWQKPQTILKPERILEGTTPLLATLPPLTVPVQHRGKSPGWVRGRPRSRLPRYPPVKRAALGR